jgi:hypothetical protein
MSAGAVMVLIPDLSGKRPHFSAKRKIFLQIHRNTLENSKVHLIRRLARRTYTYPILETFLFLITSQRFGSVAALEGRENVPDHIFLEIKKSCISGGRLWNQPDFSANLCFWRKITDANRTEIFCKISENGVANL